MSNFALLLSLLIVAVCARPVDAASTSRLRGFSVNIRTRDDVNVNTTNNALQLPLFNASMANAELQGVLAKYAKAAQFLAGEGLAPMIDVSQYYNDTISTDAVSNLASLPGMGSDAFAIGAEGTLDVGIGKPALPGVVGQSTQGSSGPQDGTNRASNAVMPLTDDIQDGFDIEYFGPLAFGSAKQGMTVDVDTGSADLWVPVNCNSCAGKNYNARASSTYQATNTRFSVTYGKGAVQGTLGYETVSVPSTSLSVTKQAFGAVNKESDFDGPSDGLVGVAFGSIASSGKPTLVENLMSNKQLAAPMYSIYLARGQQSGSAVCFGCYDSSKARGSVSWVPVVSKTYWTVGMDGLFANPTASVSTNIYAAIDTGTTFIYVPDNVASQFYSKIPGSQPAPDVGDGFYTYPCSSKLSIAFSFGGKQFAMSTKDFNLGAIDSQHKNCIGGIISLGNVAGGRLAIVGDEFLKSWYSVYDYSNGARVGFAPSINSR